MRYEKVKKLLEERNQTQLLKYYDELTEKQKENLLTAIEEMDWSFETALKENGAKQPTGKISPIEGLRVEKIKQNEDEYRKIGVKTIQEGKVAAVLLAGGMGTRLGWDGPKGSYNIGITKPLYIFEQQVKNLLEVVKECGVYPLLYIMTSDKNHEATVSFWEKNSYFGYDGNKIRFFKQDMAPATDFDGKIYLERKDMPALSPNGNGGWFSSLKRAGLYDELKKAGVEWINLYAVDNVLQRIADPVFVGATVASGKNCGAKVVCKTCPEEKVGVLCLEDGNPTIIEYYELGEEMANMREADGTPSYVYGVILNYLFKIEKLEDTENAKIPVHIVQKKIPYLNKDGETVKPTAENGKKYETLVVDLIKLMGSVLPFEVEREKEFAPIKNATGVDSVESARELLKKNGVEL